jgi:mannose-6-phosphate isomerase-like protein (cupin superfamily)
LVISGKGSVRHKDGTTELVVGDAFIFGPNEPHQLSNTGHEDLLLRNPADSPISESNTQIAEMESE